MERFENFVSNKLVKDELNTAMDANSLPHAIIIEGDEGTGKKTLAKIIAEYCVCSSDKTRPCGICKNCIKAKSLAHPDIKIVDAKEDSRLINVASIREIRSDAYIVPNEAERKAYLILNCDKMLIQAQNAFLKVFEEPPQNVIFVLTCKSATSLLETIRSRARVLSLYPADENEAIEVVQERLPDADKSDVINAVIKCDGNIGKSIEFLTNGSGTEEQLIAEQIAQSILLPKKFELLKCSAKLSSDRAFADRVLSKLYEILAEAVKITAGANSNSIAAKPLADRLTRKRLFELMNKVSEARYRIERNINMNLFGALFCSEMRL